MISGRLELFSSGTCPLVATGVDCRLIYTNLPTYAPFQQGMSPMRPLIFLLSLVVPVLTFTACTSEGETQVEVVASPTPSAAVLVVEGFFEAFNEGDIDALRSIYADDVIVTFAPLDQGPGLDTYTGLSAVLELNREHVDLHAHYTPSNVRAEGNTIVTSLFSYTDEEVERLGLAQLSGSMTFRVEQGKTNRIDTLPDEESKQKFALTRERAERGQLLQARQNLAAVLLQDGKVMAIGGFLGAWPGMA